jgi:hypothetical protein
LEESVMDFSRWMTFCLGLVAMLAFALGTPCLCKTAQAAQPAGETSPCCPSQQGQGQGEEESPGCSCGCSEIGGDDRPSSVEAQILAIQQERESHDEAGDAISASVKALLFVWFAHFVESVIVDEPRLRGSGPLVLTSHTPDYLELQVLRI